jgi:hypothetical protein
MFWEADLLSSSGGGTHSAGPLHHHNNPSELICSYLEHIIQFYMQPRNSCTWEYESQNLITFHSTRSGQTFSDIQKTVQSAFHRVQAYKNDADTCTTIFSYYSRNW